MYKKNQNVYLYKIKQNDSLDRIAMDITGSTSNLSYLAVYNNLEPPYIVSDITEYNTKATGKGIFYRDYITTDISIPAGTIVYASADSFTLYIRKYKTLSETSLTGTQTQTEEINIEAIDYGEKYNIIENKITEVEGFESYSELHFRNTIPLMNAKTYRVLQPGDYLLIPVSLIQPYALNMLIPNDDYIDYNILGADISLVDGDIVSDNDPEFNATDIKIAIGLNNIKQALTHKLQTPKGQLVNHPDYGSVIPWFLGSYSGSNLAELLRVETVRTLLTDPRVTEVKYVNVTIENNQARIEYGVNIAGSETVITDNLVFKYY